MDEKTIDKAQDSQSKQTLEVAWRRYAQLDSRAEQLDRSSNRGGLWVVFLGILFVLLTVLFDIYGELLTSESELVVKSLLVITPIVSSILAGFSRRSVSTERQVIRMGAEAIIKDIYLYRTILSPVKQRRNWLGSRLVIIQKQLSSRLGRELSLKPYNGEVPPGYSPDNLKGDPGFSDLSWMEYITFRLENRLAWSIQKKQELQGKRTRILIGVLLAGGAGALLVAFGGPLTVWAAIVGAIAIGQYGWNELRIIDKVLNNDETLISDLMKLYELRNEQPEEERKGFEFNRLVYLTEDELWSYQCQSNKLFKDGTMSFTSDLIIWSVLAKVADLSGQLIIPQEDISQEFTSDNDLLSDLPDDEIGVQDEATDSSFDTLELEEHPLKEDVEGTTESAWMEQTEANDKGELFVSLVDESITKEKSGSIAADQAHAQNDIEQEDGDIQHTNESEEEGNSLKRDDFANVFAEMRKIVMEGLSGKSINKESSASDINEILNRFQPLDKDDS